MRRLLISLLFWVCDSSKLLVRWLSDIGLWAVRLRIPRWNASLNLCSQTYSYVCEQSKSQLALPQRRQERDRVDEFTAARTVGACWAPKPLTRTDKCAKNSNSSEKRELCNDGFHNLPFITDTLICRVNGYQLLSALLSLRSASCTVFEHLAAGSAVQCGLSV